MGIFFKGFITREITLGIWSIKVINSTKMISQPLNESSLSEPTLQASDVTDVPAEFIADPFIIAHDSRYYMFFEVLDKSTNKGVIGLASSGNGEEWKYERIVLQEKYHLSYPYVFKYNNQFYMIPESCEANGVLLYKSKGFPYKWEKTCELIKGKYVDSSIFHYNNKWWMFTSKSGKLHLFFSDKLEGNWTEHPKSPLISDNYSITRPGGRVIVEGGNIFRYTQDGTPIYGSAVIVFKITKLSELEYEEEKINLILSGSKRKIDWRKDGMHTIDQLKITDNKWLIAVDGHKIEKRNYFRWKLDSIISKYILKKKNIRLKSRTRP
ncbi:glucosamine inositolphosphorylceramide transferase family protein [Neobacillus soli]|uniref:glucosamine inositolphosphorylceramide transferase family protein n=1 Tax=Neobacillus soli TaxID=220688 RepID=UPI000824B264|nr:hypothetical protein [Neobacillus soli]